ncbi:MAG: hypothetical protein EZS28_055071, partial [Streblomastix strix]
MFGFSFNSQFAILTREEATQTQSSGLTLTSSAQRCLNNMQAQKIKRSSSSSTKNFENGQKRLRLGNEQTNIKEKVAAPIQLTFQNVFLGVSSERHKRTKKKKPDKKPKKKEQIQLPIQPV